MFSSKKHERGAGRAVVSPVFSPRKAARKKCRTGSGEFCALTGRAARMRGRTEGGGRGGRWRQGRVGLFLTVSVRSRALDGARKVSLMARFALVTKRQEK
uniref:Uncharacterized protein n=1 Tax=Micromonas pusilla TaxID=38833 RepID=A0A7S0NK43_MICPS